MDSNRMIMKRIKDSNYRALLVKCADQGATFTHTRAAHLQVRHPNGVGLVTVAITPGDRRALANVRSDLRRAGFTL